jgi:hypothetical protein
VKPEDHTAKALGHLAAAKRTFAMAEFQAQTKLITSLMGSMVDTGRYTTSRMGPVVEDRIRERLRSKGHVSGVVRFAVMVEVTNGDEGAKWQVELLLLPSEYRTFVRTTKWGAGGREVFEDLSEMGAIGDWNTKVDQMVREYLDNFHTTHVGDLKIRVYATDAFVMPAYAVWDEDMSRITNVYLPEDLVD